MDKFIAAPNIKVKRAEGSDSLVKFILTDKEKNENNKANIKTLFNYYEMIGAQHINSKAPKIKSLRGIRHGNIDLKNFIDTDSDYANMAPESINLIYEKLKFFPIVPTIVRGILGAYEKTYVEYTAQAINPEVTNDILDQMNNELRTKLIENVEALFSLENKDTPPDILDQKRQLMMQSDDVKKFYETEYRTTAEQWASHTMNIENQYHCMADIERELLDQIVTTETPAIHINYMDNKYRPELIDEANLFYLNSARSRDLCESSMVGYFDYVTYSEILNRFSDKISVQDAETIIKWAQGVTNNVETFVVNNGSPVFNRSQLYEQSKHNKRTFDEMIEHHSRAVSGDDIRLYRDLLRLSYIYFYVPRKVGLLTVKSKSELVMTDLVDEYYKPTFDSVYMDKKKTKESLIDGEHIDWYYIPELWRGVKVSNRSLSRRDVQVVTSSTDDDIWIELDRFEIQFENPHYKHGRYIPIHGGSITGKSIVSICEPPQIIYNWLLNRSEQLLETEIGMFHTLPEALIPGESMEGEWGKHSLQKFAMTARDTGIAPTANPLSNGGASAIGVSGGFGQTVDLTRTRDVIDKTNLALLFEQMCYRSVGLTVEQTTGDFSPNQSALSAAMGQERVSTQLQTTFSRLNEVLLKARTTMLEVARQIAIKSPTVQMMYTTNQQSRVLFSQKTLDLILCKLGIFAKSNASEIGMVERIKTYVASNNTMGADSLEMSTLLTFKSIPELFGKLEDIHRRRRETESQQLQEAQQIEIQKIESVKAAQQAELNYKKTKDALDRENDIMVAQIEAMGYANDTAEGIQQGILSLQDANIKQKSLYDRAMYQQQIAVANQNQHIDKMNEQYNIRNMRERIELKKIEQKDMELSLRNKDIEARNARTRAID